MKAAFIAAGPPESPELLSDLPELLSVSAEPLSLLVVLLDSELELLPPPQPAASAASATRATKARTSLREYTGKLLD
jgi:hypothetical protein